MTQVWFARSEESQAEEKSMATTTSREHRRLFRKAMCAALGGLALVGGLVAAVTTGETAIDTAVGVPVLSSAPALDTRTFTTDEAAIGFYLPGTVGLRFIVR